MLLKFNDRLKTLRKNKKMSQTDLADKLNLTRSSISAWEQGVSEPTLQHVVELCYIFNCPSDYLLSINDRKFIDVTSVKQKDIDALQTLIDTLKNNS